MAVHTSLRRLSDALEYLVDDRVGIVRYVNELPREAGAPDFFHFYALASNTIAFTRQLNFSAAGGASADRGLAIGKAVGEAVERYCAAIYELDELPLCSRDAAAFPCVPPAELALYSAEQCERPGFRYVPFDDATPVRWVRAADPMSGAGCFVPAAMVYVPYTYYLGTGDAPICQPISTGLACHCSKEEAAISGICEVIERDAVMITWLAMLGMPQILVETLSDANYDLVERFERTGAKVTLFNITMDHGVPTVMGALQSLSTYSPALVVAAATSLSPEDAVRKCLEELAHTRRYSQQIKSKLPRIIPDPPDYESITGQIGHLNFYSDHANAQHAEFLFQSKERQDFAALADLSTGNPRRDLDKLCQMVAAVNHRVLLVDVTTPDVEQIGFAVIKALIPGFHPLCLGHDVRALGGYRIWEVPQKLGHKGITRETGANPAPHPYP